VSEFGIAREQAHCGAFGARVRGPAADVMIIPIVSRVSAAPLSR
jgi:hypothetical protein